MGAHEARGQTDEHYTPWFIFEALGAVFDLDVAAPDGIETCVPARRFLTSGGLEEPWAGFVWMNNPYGHESTKEAWLDKFLAHGNGIALLPDRTSATWHQKACEQADLHLNTHGKVKFWSVDKKTGLLVRGNGPGNGTTLFARGFRAVAALRRAASHGLGGCRGPIPVARDPRTVRQPENGTESRAAEIAAARLFLENRL